MNIVIVGAGGIARYAASLLSQENYNVIIIDSNTEKLEKASWDIDVATRRGSGIDWQLLDDLLDSSPDILIALTKNDEVNFVACSIAKQLGYPKTIARVRDSRFLNRARLDFSLLFNVDSFLGPELLVANEIVKYLISPGSLAIESFAHGAVLMRTLEIPAKWKKGEMPLSALDLPEGVIVGLICKPNGKKDKCEVIFPHGNDCIAPRDRVTFIGEANAISSLHTHFGIKQQKTQSVTIIGGSLTGINLAKSLSEEGVDVRLIDKNYDRCTRLVEELPDCAIIHHDATDLDFLYSEKVGSSEVFVACTSDDETNLILACLGKEVGCHDVIATLSKTQYRSLANKMGVHHVVSPKICAADHILSQVHSSTVTSLISLYENEAEIIEIKVSTGCQFVGIPLSQLGSLFPKDFLIAIIQNRGRIMVATGNRIISPGDHVILITSPRHIPKLQTMF